MALKGFQERVLGNVEVFLDALAVEYAQGNRKHAASDAWEAIGARGVYNARKTGAKLDLPNFCIKVPTGGGKTLLATQIIGAAYKRLLPERNGAGLVLWVVPSDQIYRDTLKALRDRRHFYRESLEAAVSRKIEIWEKHEFNQLSPGQLLDCLNVLVLKLQGTNRQDRESLKFFQDNSGNITRHFPHEDKWNAHRELKQQCPNLEMLVEDEKRGHYLVKTSLANLVRLCEPVVILDEGHKATSTLALETVQGFNPRLLVELSATPPQNANRLANVSGQELHDEEMIKLPINVVASSGTSMEQCLVRARDRRDELARKAEQHRRNGGKPIRPIVLVQVERTGKDVRSPEFIHAEDVREYLTLKLNVPPERVKVKSSERDDIEGIDLMHDECTVEWIITKSALQEGWDCPFAYILVSLANTKATTAVTQLVGRVLRQPYVQRTPFPELNESYVYCLKEQPETVIKEIRNALLKEGYEGHAHSVVDLSNQSTFLKKREAVVKRDVADKYGDPSKGEILLPRFCIRFDHGVETLDYYRHLAGRVDVRKFEYTELASWRLHNALKNAKEHVARVHLRREDQVFEEWDVSCHSLSAGESDRAACAWLIANLDFEWFSTKERRRIVDAAYEVLSQNNPLVKSKLGLVRFEVLSRLSAWIAEQTDNQTEAIFEGWFQDGRISFSIERAQLKFSPEVSDTTFTTDITSPEAQVDIQGLPAKDRSGDLFTQSSYTVPRKRAFRAEKALRHADDSALEKNLVEPTEEEPNEYEKAIARSIDQNAKVKWWLRNIVDRGGYYVQGPHRQRIYPDFVITKGFQGRDLPTVLVLESKGRHLAGNADSQYKQKVAAYFEEIGKIVDWQEVAWKDELGSGFKKHCFQFRLLNQPEYGDQWHDKLEEYLGS
jgi:type III restriction enzyme